MSGNASQPEEEYVDDLETGPYPSGDPETTGEKIVARTPWWTISVGLHLLTAVVVGWMWAFSASADVDPVVVSPPRRPHPIPEMDKPQLDPQDKFIDVKKKPVEDAQFRKDVEEAEVTQTLDEEEFNKAKGESEDFASDKPFNSKSFNDVIGGGGGPGGKFGGRFGGKKNCVAIGGGDPRTEDAVKAALKWLSRHQNPDGSWGVRGYTGQCSKIEKYAGSCTPAPGQEDFDAGVTGLSLLAFLGAGFTHLSKDVEDGICFGDVVRKGLQWMMSHQDPEGCIGSRTNQKYMYNHTVCALAICEAYGLTGSALFKDQAQRSVDFIIAAQNPGKGWRYSYRSGDNDSSVTGWAAMVLKSAEISGLVFPRSGYDGTRAWFDEATEDNYSRTGYTRKNTGKVFIAGVNENFNHHESLTAISVMARIFIDKNKRDARLAQGCDLLLRDKPKWDGNDIDFYYWYYASLALFQFDGPSGPKWNAWNEAMKNALVKHQNLRSSGCRSGSWEPVGRWCPEGGRVYATALNCLTLEVYYRYEGVFGTH